MQGKMQILSEDMVNAWRAYEKESIFRTLGAVGMSINNELEKKEIRLLASKLDGTSIADSFTVSNRWSLLICIENNAVMQKQSQELIRGARRKFLLYKIISFIRT